MEFSEQQLERVADLSVEDFRRDYLARRKPVVLVGLVRDWKAVRTWSPDALHRRYPRLSVMSLRTVEGRVAVDGAKGSIEECGSLEDVVGGICEGRGDRYLSTRLAALPDEARAEIAIPRHCDGSAWTNGKLWVGATGNVAPLHRDLAENVHAVVWGAKRFTLVDPRQSARLYPHRFFDPFPNGCRVDIEAPDLERFPAMEGLSRLVADLNPGDAVYIPRRWWHHVRTLEPCVSVNFWWAEGRWRWVTTAADWVKRVRGLSR